MSRRRKAPDWRPDRCKLICTNRGEHAPTFLGWVRFLEARPSEFDWEPATDEIRYLSNSGDRFDVEREFDTVSTIDQFERELSGHRAETAEDRERWRFATCPRCRSDIPIRAENMARIVRAAIESGVSELDVSRLRGPMH